MTESGAFVFCTIGILRILEIRQSLNVSKVGSSIVIIYKWMGPNPQNSSSFVPLARNAVFGSNFLFLPALFLSQIDNNFLEL